MSTQKLETEVLAEAMRIVRGETMMLATKTHLATLAELNRNLFDALRRISSLWPEPPHCAPVNPEWVGERDGKMRAILLEAALDFSRAAIADYRAAMEGMGCKTR